MWDEEIFSLQWLEAESVYQVLNPTYIEEKREQKLSLKTNKGREIIVEEEKISNEERFKVDLQQAMMISKFETTLAEGESSRIPEEETNQEEQLVDYEPSPEHVVTPTVILPSDDDGDDVEEIALSSWPRGYWWKY